MNIKTDLSANDWLQYAQDILMETTTLANALRIEQPGFDGFISIATAYTVREGMLNVYLSLSNGDIVASAILHTPNGTAKEMGSTKIERPAIAA